MSYRNKFGRTEIKSDNYNNLSISWDTDKLNAPKKKRFPVLLFIPDVDQFSHDHIVLDKKMAKKLHKWLTDYLKDCK